MSFKNLIYNKLLIEHKAKRVYRYSKRCSKEQQNAIKNNAIDNVYLLYITVAFNNAEVLEYQIKAIKKFSSNYAYAHLVVDNSNKEDQSILIEKLCVEMGISYVKLPSNPFKLSYSHAAALNWTCSNIIKKLSSVYWVAFLDHDCIPIQTINPDIFLKGKKVYGRKQDRDEKWYLWPGFAFFNLKYIKEFDFLPTTWGDTGAKMYEKCLASMDNQFCSFANHRYEVIHRITDKIDVFDESWIHLMNASKYVTTRDDSEKFNAVYEMLNKIFEL